MPSARWPAVQGRILTRELRQMRRAAGMTLQQVAAALYLSVSKIQRMERGARVSVPELRALLEVYGVTDPARAGEMTRLTTGATAHTWHDGRLREHRSRPGIPGLSGPRGVSGGHPRLPAAGHPPAAADRGIRTGRGAGRVLSRPWQGPP